MTTVQRVAQIFGVVFILVALAGFYTGGMNMFGPKGGLCPS